MSGGRLSGMGYLALIAVALTACVGITGSHGDGTSRSPSSESPVSAQRPDGFDRASCTFKGHRLYGKIRVVRALADVKVEVVTAFADLRVQKVTAFANACGKWEMVDGIADTTVEFVTAFADVKIELVDAFPGVR